MTQTPPIVFTGTMFTMVWERQTLSMTSGNANWNALLSAYKARDYERCADLLQPAARLVQNALRIPQQFRIHDGRLYHGDTVIESALAKRCVEMYTQGFPVDPMFKFLERIQANPSYRAQQQLYQFMERNQLPLTEDGCFLAYKLVNEHFRDCYTDTIDNSVGVKVSLPRHQVDDDPKEPCSVGLHVCSRSYLKLYHGKHLVVVKIDPADVVSVPHDYSNAKMRVCAYEVLDVVDPKDAQPVLADRKDLWDAPVTSATGTSFREHTPLPSDSRPAPAERAEYEGEVDDENGDEDGDGDGDEDENGDESKSGFLGFYP